MLSIVASILAYSCEILHREKTAWQQKQLEIYTILFCN